MAVIKGCLELQDVVFCYDTASRPVFDGLSVQFPAGWTGVIGPNGSGKSTLLRLACHELEPNRGVVRSPDEVIYCPQRTDDPPDAARAFVRSSDGNACALRGRLGIDPEWLDRWNTLSHGERKRIQIAVALWQRPRVLAIDEPTNHIDLPTRRMLADALKAFRGIGLLVSHDRELLDALCGQCLYVERSGTVMRPGGYSQSIELAEAEQAQAREARQKAHRELKRLQRDRLRRRQAADRSDRLRSKRGLDAKDHDAKDKIDLARVSGKDGQAGRKLRQIQGRVERAQNRADRIETRKDKKLGIRMSGQRSRCDAIFRLPAGAIGLGEGRRLTFPELSLSPTDRIALIGPNGSGKSTLVRHIVERLELPAEKVVVLAQEVDRDQARSVMAEVRELPSGWLGEVLAAIDNLGSDPMQVMETEEPSPGEVRKLILALGLARTPQLIVMDEPTNHLDLPSIECLEKALGGVGCALLLVSHDVRFLERLTETCWEISAALELVVRRASVS